MRNQSGIALSVLLLLIFGGKQLNAQSMPVGQVSGNLRARAAVAKENNLFVAEIKNNAPEPCSKTNEQSYDFNHWFPVSGCSPDAVQNFFQVSGSLSIANTVHYLYSPNQSTNQIGTDLLTATFPLGFQAILSGTATAGGSQPSSTSQGTTDSVDTAVSKLENGGDFNIRFPYPVYYHATSGYGVYMLTSPSVGFNVNGLTGQNTITESTEYNVNVPLEFYAQTSSIEKKWSDTLRRCKAGNGISVACVRVCNRT